ncbi:Plant PDR ABC transporter associated [Dillenia turbinata]|uniref:Plant PDR ABC transporter associated n=1 Tax=Dillenia turbinata TaxID=194707 RepID=A0AAN8UP47_9MAGN
MEGLERMRSSRAGMSRNGSSANWSMEDVFVTAAQSRRSSHAEEDEEALRWAAIEKLPTYNRLRTTLIESYVETEVKGSKVEHKAVDVTKLDVNDRQQFIDRIFKVAEEDNEKFLKKFRDRIDRMTLLLGPPASGKTTLLLALAGKLDPSLQVLQAMVGYFSAPANDSWLVQAHCRSLQDYDCCQHWWSSHAPPTLLGGRFHSSKRFVFCTTASDNLTKLGVKVLENFGIFPHNYWFWIGSGALLGFTILFNILFTFALMFLSPPGKPQAVMTKEMASEMEADQEDSNEEPRLKVSGSKRESESQTLYSDDGNNTREMTIRQMSSRSNSNGLSRNADSALEAATGVAAKKGMILPFSPLAMSFDNVNYYVDMPPWWIWYYWICPVAWTVYGLIVSQYGDLDDRIQVPGMATQPTIKEYIQNQFGFDPDFIGPVAAVLVGFTVFFAFMYAFCIKNLNFQMR